MIRAVLLDIDGTLVDAMAAWGAAFGEALALGSARYPALGELGDGPAAHIEVLRPLLREAHREAGSGEWSRDLLRVAFTRLLERHAQRDDVLAGEMCDTYETAWPHHIRLYPEVPALLDALAGRYRLGIVSNGLGSEQRLKIGPLGLDRYVEAVAISEELGVRKPAPAIFQHALKALGVTAHEAVHVGDDFNADIEGAYAAGLVAGVWVNRPGNRFAEHAGVRSRSPHIEVPDLAGLASLIESL
jgi:putative hydrolase of the HAD superfamily